MSWIGNKIWIFSSHVNVWPFTILTIIKPFWRTAGKKRKKKHPKYLDELEEFQASILCRWGTGKRCHLLEFQITNRAVLSGKISFSAFVPLKTYLIPFSTRENALVTSSQRQRWDEDFFFHLIHWANFRMDWMKFRNRNVTSVLVSQTLLVTLLAMQWIPKSFIASYMKTCKCMWPVAMFNK